MDAPRDPILAREAELIKFGPNTNVKSNQSNQVGEPTTNRTRETKRKPHYQLATQEMSRGSPT